jgi:preprotein translocase subunit SecD
LLEEDKKTMAKLNYSLLIFILAAIVAGCTKIPGFRATNGMAFTVRVETGKANAPEVVADRAVKIMKFRLDAVGIDADLERDPAVPDGLNIKIYGDQEWDRIKAFLFETHELELKKAVTAPYPAPLTTYPTNEAAQTVVKPGQEVLPYSDRDEGAKVYRFVIVESEPIVTGEDIRDASAVPANRNYSIAFTLRPNAAERFGNWTSTNINSYLAIVLDERVRTAAFIKGRIGDNGQVDGSFSKIEAEDIALSLKSGALPAKLTVITEKPFGN